MKNPLTPAGIEPATFRFVATETNRRYFATVYYEAAEKNNRLTQ